MIEPTHNAPTGTATGDAQQSKTKRQPIRCRDAEGKPIVRVPLANDNGFATLDAADYDRLMERGVSMNWYCNRSGRGRPYVRTHTTRPDGRRNTETVQRIIMQAGRRETVMIRDGDTMNLRRRNLRVITRREQVADHLERHRKPD